jgi:DNA-binding winged helix-turn-helix (wHTH) protein/Tfp pilus assembly protein PilF
MQYGYLDLIIDVDARQACRAGAPLDVAGLSFDLLACMLRQGDRVVSTDELIDAVWAPALVTDETVTQRIKLLRQALGDDSRHPRYIRTVRGRGYQLCGPVAERELAPVRHTGSRAHVLPGKVLAGAALGAVLLLGALWWPTTDRRLPERSSQTRADASGPNSAEQQAVDALLARARHYAAIGQRDDGLRAIDLYRQALALRPDDLQAKLGLSFASSAMMCRHNDGIDRALVAHRLAQEVITTDPSNAAAFAARAYAADCRGLIDQAIADYRRAIAIDPEGRLDSLASLAHLLAIRGDLAQALAANLEARSGAADLPLIDLQLAHNLELLGYAAAAERLLRRSFQLYPDNAFVAAAWPAYLFRQGRIQQATDVLAVAIQRPQHPTLWLLAAELALLDGDRATAVVAYEQAAALKPGSGPAQSLRRIYMDQLDHDWGNARLQDLRLAIAAGDRWPDNWLEVAALKLALGDAAAALQALDQARQAGYRDRLQLALSPQWRELRESPGFTVLLEDIASAIAVEREQARQVPGLAELLAEGVQ